eukprot:1001858-Amphidinium_carterae.2
MVVADVKYITIRNLDQKIEGMWLGKSTSKGEHIIAVKNNNGVALYTCSLTRMTADRQWSLPTWMIDPPTQSPLRTFSIV